MTSRGEQCGKSVHDIRQTESSQADDQWRCRTTELNQLVVCELVLTARMQLTSAPALRCVELS